MPLNISPIPDSKLVVDSENIALVASSMSLWRFSSSASAFFKYSKSSLVTLSFLWRITGMALVGVGVEVSDLVSSLEGVAASSRAGSASSSAATMQQNFEVFFLIH